MQPKAGGKLHLKLNTGTRPIAKKYREGKMKSTLKRELKSTWNRWRGSECGQQRSRVDSAGEAAGRASSDSKEPRRRSAVVESCRTSPGTSQRRSDVASSPHGEVGRLRCGVGRYMPCEGASSDRGDAVSVAACAVRLDGRAGCGGAGADCSQCAPVVGCARPVAVVGALRALAVKWPLSTRLETRTKESSMRASLGVLKPVGAMKVNVLSRVRAVAVRGVGASSTDLVRSRWGSSGSTHAGTRKMVNYARIGWSQRKLWWRLVAILTCKSIVKFGYRGERLIEPSSSWFPPKFPSG